MAWPDARLGEFGAQNQKIAFARTELMPLPSIFLSPPSGPGGKDITIQGSNFQPDQDVFLEISGAIVSTVRSDADGRFTARLFIPIAGQGAHDFRAIDASGNIATGSFFMDFGFDNIEGSMEDIIGQLEFLTGGSGGQTPAEIASQLQTIQASLGGLDQIQSALDGLEADDDSEGVKVWLVIVIALVVALAASSLGLLLGTRMARGRLA